MAYGFLGLWILSRLLCMYLLCATRWLVFLHFPFLRASALLLVVLLYLGAILSISGQLQCTGKYQG